MSARTDDDAEYNTLGTDAADLEQLTEVTLDDGGVIIYDEDDSEMWIQSDAALDIEAMA
jgi:hypothetical protein